MSAPHSPAIDTSSRSAETLQDISLGSLPSFSSPGGNKLRVPSTSSQATAFSNPPTHSSPQTASFSRRKTDDLHSTPLRRSTFSKADEDGNATVADETTGNGDMLDSSVRDGKVDALATPMPNRTSGKRKSGKAGSSLTLRDQEKVGSASWLRSFVVRPVGGCKCKACASLETCCGRIPGGLMPYDRGSFILISVLPSTSTVSRKRTSTSN